MVSNITKSQREICNYLYTPDLKVADAIRMSTSIPYIFQPVIYNECYYVDGGLYDNYPSDLFSNDSNTTLGFKLVIKGNVDYEEPKNLLDYSYQLVASIDKVANKKYKENNSSLQTIEIQIPNISTFDFELSNEIKGELINAGKEATINHFKKIKLSAN